MPPLTAKTIKKNFADSAVIYERGLGIYQNGAFVLKESDSNQGTFLYAVDEKLFVSSFSPRKPFPPGQQMIGPVRMVDLVSPGYWSERQDICLHPPSVGRRR